MLGKESKFTSNLAHITLYINQNITHLQDWKLPKNFSYELLKIGVTRESNFMERLLFHLFLEKFITQQNTFLGIPSEQKVHLVKVKLDR